MSTVGMRVEGMTCEDCALVGAGATQPHVDFRRGEARTRFEGDPEAPAAAVRDAGYLAGALTALEREDGAVVPLRRQADYDLVAIGAVGLGARAIVSGETRGLIKVVAERGSGRHRRPGSGRRDPGRRLRGQVRAQRPRSGGYLGALPDHRRGPQSRHPDLHHRRGEVQLLRGLSEPERLGRTVQLRKGSEKE